MNSVKIINLNPTEWQKYKAIRLTALQDSPHAYGSSYESNANKPDQMWQDLLEEAIKGEKQWFSFAESEHTLVGMVGAYLLEDKQTVNIAALYVDKNFRGQGIAKQLMEDIISKIQENMAVKKLELHVNVDQESAVSLYKSSGFNITKTIMMKLGDGNEHECYEMIRVL